MNLEPDPLEAPPLEGPPPAFLSSRGLGVVAMALFVVFSTAVLGVAFPFLPLDPGWQLRMTGALIQSAPFPLVGLALLQLAMQLDPEDPILWRRWRRCSRLAVAATLGFLLLCPLQAVASLQESRSFNTAQSSRITAAERKLISLRRAVSTAASNAALKQQLQRLDGPALGPAEMAQPPPLLKAQVGVVLDQAEAQISSERVTVSPVNPWTLLPDLLRRAVASLGLAIGFAALAVRPGHQIPMLQECQDLWILLRRRQASRRRQSDQIQDDLEYMDQINEDVNPD